MRKVIEQQMKIGEVDISDIKLDLRSRDEIPKLLMGLQHIYSTPDLMEAVFSILESIIPDGIRVDTGRRGMTLWKILVLGVIRLNCNWDYDKLQEMANNHLTLRQMLGHGITETDYKYALQTLKDNVRLLTPEILDEINKVVVKAGHNLVKKKDVKIKGKCDSFVVETAVHFPTDISLLFDAICKVITLLSRCCREAGLSDWRQSMHILRKIKRLYRRIQKLRRSTSKDKATKKKREEQILSAYKSYLELVQLMLVKIDQTLDKLDGFSSNVKKEKSIQSIQSIKEYIRHAERQIYQINRRAINGEKIPHAEKVFSIFEEHTEWISKGKAGVPQELGLKVCILDDQYGFILNHKVMQKQTDEQITISIVEETKKNFPDMSLCSFDKGFYSPENKIELEGLLDKVILPKKGKLSKTDREREHSDEFIEARHKHSAVESGINALEQHGLDRCPDHGIDGFKRYVAIAVLGRNLQVLGNVIQQKELKIQKRKKKIKKARATICLKIAA